MHTLNENSSYESTAILQIFFRSLQNRLLPSLRVNRVMNMNIFFVQCFISEIKTFRDRTTIQITAKYQPADFNEPHSKMEQTPVSPMTLLTDALSKQH